MCERRVLKAIIWFCFCFQSDFLPTQVSHPTTKVSTIESWTETTEIKTGKSEHWGLFQCSVKCGRNSWVEREIKYFVLDLTKLWIGYGKMVFDFFFLQRYTGECRVLDFHLHVLQSVNRLTVYWKHHCRSKAQPKYNEKWQRWLQCEKEF